MITPTYPCQRVAQYRHWLIHIPSGTWPTAMSCLDHTTPNRTGTGVYLSMRSENLTALRFIEHMLGVSDIFGFLKVRPKLEEE